MGDMIEVNISLLKQDAEQIEERIAGLKQGVNKLCDIGTELDAMWEGEAKKIFVTNLARGRNSIDCLLQEAGRISKLLKEAVGIYQNCENAVSLEIDEIRV